MASRGRVSAPREEEAAGMRNETEADTRAMTRGEWGFLGSFVLLKVLLHLPVLTRYGYHHDELYFLACGRHLSWGYVDHAPLVPWLARISAQASATPWKPLVLENLPGSRLL